MGSVSNWSIGEIVMTGRVNKVGLFHINIDGIEVIVKLQGVAVEVFRHVEMELARKWKMTGGIWLSESSALNL